MKKIITIKHIWKLLLLVVIFSGTTISSFACDACGCSSGGNFVGLLPQFNKKFVGVRFKNSLFNVDPTTLQGLHDHSNQFAHTNSYSTTEVWARFFPAKRLQVMAFVPFGMNNKSENGVHEEISGIGDMSAIASYVVFNTTDSLENSFRHAFLLGSGVKLPTGKYQQRDAGKVLYAPGFQIGTGAYSLLFNGIYTARLNKWGVNLNTSYSLNGTAENDYHFGNSLSGAATVFYWLKGKEFTILPNAGIFHDRAAADKQYGVEQALTRRGHDYLTMGTEFYIKRYALGVNYHVPVTKQDPTHSPISNGRVFATFSVVF